MFTQTATQSAMGATVGYQGRQGGGPVIAGVSDNARPMKIYGDQLVIFIADNSGSMSGAKATEASQALATCLQELADPANKDGFRASVIPYGSSAYVAHSANEPLAAMTTLDGNGGGTSLAPALSLAEAEVNNYSPRADRRIQSPVIIVFSDGQLGDGAQAEIEAQRLKQMGCKLITIGFGSDADEAQLRRLATAPDHYAFANVGGLKTLFAQVGKTLSQQIR